MKKRIVSTLLTVVMAASLLVGCGNKETATETKVDAGEAVELSFIGWGGPEDQELIGDIIEEFEKENPNIHVKFEIPADYWPKLQSVIATEDAPDVFYLGFPEFVEYYNQGVLVDMDEYLADVDLSKYADASLKAFQNEDGKQFGMPKDWGTYVFYYNKKLFEEAGVKSPLEYVEEGNWTMDTMLEVAKEIQANSDAEFGVAVEPNRWKAFVGDEWVTADKKVDVTSEQFAKDLQFMADLWLTEKVAPNVEDLTNIGASDRFQQGNTAMFMSGRWMSQTLKNSEDLEWDIVPMPVARENDEYTWVDSVCLSIPVTCEHKDEAMKFIKFYTSEWAQTEMANRGLAIPVIDELAESDAFLNSMGGVNNAAHTQYEASTLPVFDHWNEIWTELNNGFTDVFNGKITAEEGVKAAQEAVDQIQE